MSALSFAESIRYVTDGFLIRSAVVDQKSVEAAHRMILEWLNSAEFDASQIDHYNNRTFAQEFGSDSRILSLAESPEVRDVIGSIVPDSLPIERAQIAIRLPRGADYGQPVKLLHVDGVNCPHLEEGRLNTFSLLVGVLLTDVVDPQHGALRVVRGGHWRMADWFLSGDYEGSLEQVPPDIEEEPHEAILGRAGDVVFSHHLLPHAVAENTGSSPRIVVYFRVSSTALPGDRIKHLKDPWLSMAGLREFHEDR